MAAMMAECTWDGEPNERTIAHIIKCPGCTEAFPLIADYYGRPNPHCGCSVLGPCEHHKDWQPPEGEGFKFLPEDRESWKWK